MKFEIYQDEKGEWRWRLRAANGETIATSGEGYKNHKHAFVIITKIRQAIADGDYVIEYGEKK
ncbi:MAG TPA: DUF1508 domain-containing protein [Pyrinomonadaceae bacterium]|jgi:uncharacterized protein YegP (UPF0339 family)